MEARDSKILGNDKWVNTDHMPIKSSPSRFFKVSQKLSPKNSSISDQVMKNSSNVISNEENDDVSTQVSKEIDRLKKILEESRKVFSSEGSLVDSN